LKWLARLFSSPGNGERQQHPPTACPPKPSAKEDAGGLYGNGERQQPLKPEIVHDNLKKLQ
jgi:hypothetical protein